MAPMGEPFSKDTLPTKLPLGALGELFLTGKLTGELFSKDVLSAKLPLDVLDELFSMSKLM
ncbi:5359_t:CDS:1, partial [Ambispora leptoticha]